MSVLLENLLKQSRTDARKSVHDGIWYIAKPLNETREFSPFLPRLIDAWRVLWCKSFAVHYREDEP